MRCKNILKNKNRKRYIGFTISKNTKRKIDRLDFKEIMSIKCKELFKKDFKEMGIKIIKFDNEKGIIRCNHLEKENTIKLLNSINQINTIGTSGTIKTLTKKYMIIF